MKILRIGKKGKEKPAVIDKNGIIKDLSSVIKDFNPETLNHRTINKIKNACIKIGFFPKRDIPN